MSTPTNSFPGTPKSAFSSLIPTLRYRNAMAAIDWLCRAFGLERHAVYADGQTVHHAQLVYGGGMIMLGSATSDGEYGALTVQPGEVGLRSTGGIYLAVPDADAVYATARAALAEIVIEIRDMDYGGRGFTCRDIEGHLWSIGSYDPWAGHPGR